MDWMLGELCLHGAVLPTPAGVLNEAVLTVRFETLPGLRRQVRISLASRNSPGTSHRLHA